ncbi:cupin domain-containing protein [Conexibacter stalactiti]|uniref:Cupin domain-containing protein n=1 Tax=Conexibacter stalactiti TaxID=1940611 RepID=A0ABU4HWM6_9ACTN|nr:cupin domain-containing protein [Conexibacter stalactiti]MDW5597726.1 cupin domain-containing protein [Conexibacter stalactiti]MEC5038368.1 cupin domain-containing protein [Conexibacter stalactiti]
MSAPPVALAVTPVAADPAAAYALFELLAPAGAALPPHICARHDATLTVLDGEVEVVLAGERRLLGPGSQLRLQRGRPRRVAVVADARLLCLSVPAGLQQLAEALAEPSADRDDLAALLADGGVTLLPAGWGAQVR